MPSAIQKRPAKSDPGGAALMTVLRRVARRADEISRQARGGQGSDLEHWLQAEREVFEQQDIRLILS